MCKFCKKQMDTLYVFNETDCKCTDFISTFSNCYLEQFSKVDECSRSSSL